MQYPSASLRSLQASRSKKKNVSTMYNDSTYVSVCHHPLLINRACLRVAPVIGGMSGCLRSMTSKTRGEACELVIVAACRQKRKRRNFPTVPFSNRQGSTISQTIVRCNSRAMSPLSGRLYAGLCTKLVACAGLWPAPSQPHWVSLGSLRDWGREALCNIPAPWLHPLHSIMSNVLLLLSAHTQSSSSKSVPLMNSTTTNTRRPLTSQQGLQNTLTNFSMFLRNLVTRPRECPH